MCSVHENVRYIQPNGQGGSAIPFTPFHFGPGLLVKACSPRRFWLTSFVLANVLIDVEVLYYLRHNDPPIHRYLHTYVGSIGAGMVAGLLMFGVSQVAQRFISPRWQSFERLAAAPKHCLLVESVVAGLVGGLSHVLLDSFMHRDMNPFWPVLEGNGLVGTMGLGTLHIGLALAGILGGILWLFLFASRPR